MTNHTEEARPLSDGKGQGRTTVFGLVRYQWTASQWLSSTVSGFSAAIRLRELVAASRQVSPCKFDADGSPDRSSSP